MAMTQKQFNDTLWAAANVLRGSMDAGEFKSYVFPALFYKWISDTWDYHHAIFVEENNEDLERLAMLDGDEYSTLQVELEEIEADYHAFAVPDGCRWQQVVSKVDLPDLTVKTPVDRTDYVGKRLRDAMNAITKANPAKLAGIFGVVDYADTLRIPESSLTGMLEKFDQVTLNPEEIPGDMMGAGYEYLLKEFSDSGGQKAGEFFTPRSVVHLLTKILDPQPGESIYDPAVGSGGMLIEATNVVQEAGGDPRSIKLYGQEKNLTTNAIARMNLYINKLGDHDIRHGDTLRKPEFVRGGQLERFDVVLANPPYSLSSWGADVWANDAFGRAFCAVPPKENGDWAWIQHMLTSVKSTGRVGIVMSNGVLFRSNSRAEVEIRQCIVEKDFIEAVIAMPDKLFYATPIPVCLIILRKEKPPEMAEKIMFIDASERYVPATNQNEMSERDIETILAAYREQKDTDGEGGLKLRVVDRDEVLVNNCDLKVKRYVKSVADVDIDADAALDLWRESAQVRANAESDLLIRLREAGFIA